MQRSIRRNAGRAVVATTVMATAGAVSAQENNARFYGFLNPMIVSVDDGFSSNTQLADNSNGPSRIGLWWETGLSGGTLKFNFESSLGIRGAGGLSQTNPDPDFFNFTRASLRKVEFIYEGNFGKISVGQGSMSTDGMAAADLSGTSFASTRSISDISAAYAFHVTGSGGTTFGPTVGAAFSDFDGGRLGRIRYDSPRFAGGFGVAASVGENILVAGADDLNYDLSLLYDAENGGMKYMGRLGALWVDGRNGNPDNTSVVGSFSALHLDSGISGTLVAGWRDNSGLGSNYIYTKLGIRRDWLSWGETRLSADFFWGNDSVTAGDNGFTWGVQA
ncbi:MAG: porin, partial [Shimia sp.]|nr:porin [Shimia sp.]